MSYDQPAAKPESSLPRIQARPLEGLTVGLSVSCGEDSALHGFTEEEMNRAIVRLSDVLLSAGAQLVFGHDWRPGGVMSAVARLAVAHEPAVASADDQAARRVCRITNLVPWDRKPELPPDLRDDLEQRGILRIEQVPLPTVLAQQEAEIGKRTVRAAALCLLRRRLAELCDARICLGGKFQKYEGFWPGILEEVFTSALQSQGNQVLLSGMLGGAAERILQAARTGNWENLLELNSDVELRKGFASLQREAASLFPELRQAPEVLSWNNLQQRSGLNETDWESLVGATDIEVVSALAIKALR
jgi:hypothetical protein